MAAQLNQTRLLYEHANKLLTSSSLDEIAEHSIDIMKNVIGANISAFMVIEGNDLRIIKNSPGRKELHMKMDGPGVTVQVANSGKAEIIPDLRKIDYYVEGSVKTRSELVVPIIVDGIVYGVLNIEDTEPDRYSEDTLELMDALASQVAIAVKSLKRLQALKSIQSYTRDFILKESFQEIGELTFKVLSETIDVTYGSLHVVEGDMIHEVYTVGIPPENHSQHINGKGVICRAYRTQEIQNVKDVNIDPDYFDDPPAERVKLNSELAVPVIHEGKVIAVINVEDQAFAQFTVDDQMIVEIIADTISFWYDNKLLNEKNLSNMVVESRYRNIFELSPVGIMTFSVLGFMTSCNKATCELTGYPRDDIIGKHISLLPFLNQKTVSFVMTKVYELIRGEQPGNVEFQYSTQNGEFRWAEGAGRLIAKPSSGNELLVVFEDTTEAKNRLEERLLFETQLTEEKMRAEHAIEMGRLKSSFVSNATHKLRTPLTSVIGYMELIGDAIKQERYAECVSYFETMKRNVYRLFNISDNFLDIQRYQRNTVDREEVPVSELIDKALAEIVPFNMEKKLRINSYIRVSSPDVMVDRDRVKMVLVNLLNNSIKYSPPGSTASVTVVEDEVNYTFSVSDHGIGLSPVEVKRMFMRSSIMGPCLGIGLSICKENIEMHGGRIWCESDGLGEGATFHFTIPKPVTPPLHSTS